MPASNAQYAPLPSAGGALPQQQHDFSDRGGVFSGVASQGVQGSTEARELGPSAAVSDSRGEEGSEDEFGPPDEFFDAQSVGGSSFSSRNSFTPHTSYNPSRTDPPS